MRWHLTKGGPDGPTAALDILNGVLGTPPPGEPLEETQATTDATRGRRLVRCPWATTTGLPEARTRGRYAKDYPRGAVVHFTAGSHRQKPEDAVAYMVNRGHLYFVISPKGEVFQNFPLTHWGYHCGESKWPGLGSSLSDTLVGIEIMCPGKLNADGSPWYGGGPFDKALTRRVAKSDGQREAGLYYRYTLEQEAALEKLVRWLENNNPNVFKFENVLGHDEVSGPRGLGRQRKNDPGGSLSLTMDDFRAKLKA